MANHIEAGSGKSRTIRESQAKIPPPAHVNQLQNAVKAQSEFRQSIEKSTHFSAEEKAYLQVDSEEAFKHIWSDALTTKKHFDERRGPGGAESKLAAFASCTQEIFNSMSPMVDLLKDTGVPYVGIALGTLSFFFMIVKTRFELEEKITSTLQVIQKRLPGLRMFREIYNSDHELSHELQSGIIETYQTFVSFCIVSTRFYTRNKISRWLGGLKKPSSVDEAATAVELAITNVRLLCEELLNNRLYQMDHVLADVRLLAENRKTEIQDLQAENDNARLEGVRAALNTPAYSDEQATEDLVRLRSSAANEYRQMPGSCLEMVKYNAAFLEWQQRIHESAVLIIASHNSAHSARHCWVTPAVLDYYNSLAGNSDVCVHYLFGNQHKDETFTHVVSNLASRLMSKNKHLRHDDPAWAHLTLKVDRFRSAQAKSRSAGVPSDLTDEAVSLLHSVLNMFPDGTVVRVLLDRAELCQSVQSCKAHRDALMRTLVRVAEGRSGKVVFKVLAIVNVADWRVEEQLKANPEDFEQRSKESLKIVAFVQPRQY